MWQITICVTFKEVTETHGNVPHCKIKNFHKRNKSVQNIMPVLPFYSINNKNNKNTKSVQCVNNYN